jgi:DNA-binding XRE family transcriptional regulator
MAKLNRHPQRPAAKHRPRTLRVLRAECELTQQLIAAAANMTQTRYWQIEHGQGAPLRQWECTVIARLLGVAAQDIAWPQMKVTQLQRTRAEAQERRRMAIAESI